MRWIIALAAAAMFLFAAVDAAAVAAAADRPIRAAIAGR